MKESFSIFIILIGINIYFIALLCILWRIRNWGLKYRGAHNFPSNFEMNYIFDHSVKQLRWHSACQSWGQDCNFPHERTLSYRSTNWWETLDSVWNLSGLCHSVMTFWAPYWTVYLDPVLTSPPLSGICQAVWILCGPSFLLCLDVPPHQNI